MQEILERLVAANIHLLPLVEIPTHFVFERNGFAALVEHKENGFGAVGTSGVLTPQGLAMLVWRGGNPFFVLKGYQQPATPEQIEELRLFARDLGAALKAG